MHFVTESYCKKQIIYLVDKAFDSFGKYSINLSDIVTFQVTGTIYNELHISGGGGGGSSISGAILGGLIAGEAGAIIGSRKETNEIQSTNVKIDNRFTYVVYLNNEGNERLISFSGEMYDILLRAIPEKEATFLANKSATDEVASLKEMNTTSTKIRELGKLRAEGIISEAEYKSTKERLLNSIN